VIAKYRVSYIAPGDTNAKDIEIGLGDKGLEVEKE
jgi:hypothetical protein